MTTYLTNGRLTRAMVLEQAVIAVLCSGGIA